MSIPYPRLIIHAFSFGFFMTGLSLIIDNGWSTGRITTSLVGEFFLWSLVGVVVSVSSWRSEGYLERKNAKWLAKRKKK